MAVELAVTLSIAELERAALVGALREVDGIRRGRHDNAHRHGIPREPGARWAISCLGAIGEAVVSKATGIPWNTSLDAHVYGEDVGSISVRTGQVGGKCLIVRDYDPDDKPMVLVTGDRDRYTVHGWIMGRDAKRPEWLTDKGTGRKPAWFVPKEHLRDIRELVQMLAERN